MATAQPNAKDPRYRPFRVAAYVGYLVVVSVFSLAVIVGVVRGVARINPGAQQASPPFLEVEECRLRARALWGELEQRQRSPSAADADQRWVAFRAEWLSRLRTLESHCFRADTDRDELRQTFRRLERVMDLYTTRAVQYAADVAPEVEVLERHLEPRARP